MSREEMYAEVNFGGEICRQLKNIYFPTEKRDAKLANRVALIFSQLKHLAKPYFVDDDQLEMLRKIAHYSTTDFADLLDVIGFKLEQDVLHGTNQNRINMATTE